MKIEIALESPLEKIAAGLLCGLIGLACLAAVFSLMGGEARAEWDSSSAFGDSYCLEEIADNLADCAAALEDISYTLDSIEGRI
ncbi:hypothetical protein JW921_03130 [Candidatus Fermentibacterales bacterium]|nr:hypothetical protein [Candidatus Fermentibacterales bacterium]